MLIIFVFVLVRLPGSNCAVLLFKIWVALLFCLLSKFGGSSSIDKNVEVVFHLSWSGGGPSTYNGENMFLV